MKRRSPSPRKIPHTMGMSEVRRQYKGAGDARSPSPARMKGTLPPMDPPAGSHIKTTMISQPKLGVRLSPEPLQSVVSPPPVQNQYVPVGVKSRKKSILAGAGSDPNESQFKSQVTSTPAAELSALFTNYLSKANDGAAPFDSPGDQAPPWYVKGQGWSGEADSPSSFGYNKYNSYGYGILSGGVGGLVQHNHQESVNVSSLDDPDAPKSQFALSNGEQLPGPRQDAAALVKVIKRLIAPATQDGLGLAGSEAIKMSAPLSVLSQTRMRQHHEAAGDKYMESTQKEMVQWDEEQGAAAAAGGADGEVDPLQQAEFAKNLYNLCFEHLIQLETESPEKVEIIRLVLTSMNSFYHELVKRCNEDRRKVLEVMSRLDNAKKKNEEATATIFKVARHYNRQLAEAEGNNGYISPAAHREDQRIVTGLATKGPAAELTAKMARSVTIDGTVIKDSVDSNELVPELPSLCTIEAYYGEASNKAEYEMPYNVTPLITNAMKREETRDTDMRTLPRQDSSNERLSGTGGGDYSSNMHYSVSKGRPPTGSDTLTSYISTPAGKMATRQSDSSMSYHNDLGMSPMVKDNLAGLLGSGLSDGDGMALGELKLNQNNMVRLVTEVQLENRVLKEDKKRLSVEVMALQDMLRRARAILAQLKRERHPVVEGETSQILAQAVKRLKAVSLAQPESQNPRIRHHIDFIDCVLKAAQEASVAGEHGGGVAFKRGFVDSMEHQMSAWLLSLQSSVQKALAPTDPGQDNPHTTQRKHLISEARKVLVRLVKTWQTSFLAITFGSWFKYAISQRKLRKSLGVFFKHWFGGSNKVDDYFYRWRQRAAFDRRENKNVSLEALLKTVTQERDDKARMASDALREVDKLKSKLQEKEKHHGKVVEELKVSTKKQKVPKEMEAQLKRLQMSVIPVARLCLALGEASLQPLHYYLTKLRNKPDATQLCRHLKMDALALKGPYDDLVINLTENNEESGDEEDDDDDDDDDSEADDGDLDNISEENEHRSPLSIVTRLSQVPHMDQHDDYFAVLKETLVKDDQDNARRLKNLERLPFDEVLLNWINYQLRSSEDRTERGSRGGSRGRGDSRGRSPGRLKDAVQTQWVANFDHDLSDGLAFAKLLASVAPEVIEPKLQMTLDPATRMGLIEKVATQLNAQGILQVDQGALGTMEGRAERQAAFVAQLFATRSGLDKDDTKEEINMMRTKVQQLQHTWDTRLRPWLEVVSRDPQEEENQGLDDAQIRLLEQAPSDELRKRLESKMRAVSKARQEFTRAQEPQMEEYPMFSSECEAAAEHLTAVTGLGELLEKRVSLGQDLYDRLREKAVSFGFSMLGSLASPNNESALRDHKAERDYKEYTRVEEVQIRDVLKADGREGAAATQECDHIQKVLAKHWQLLMQVFRFYAAGVPDGSIATMNSPEFWKFIKDIRLQDSGRKISNELVNEIFMEVNIDKATGLTYSQYAETLAEKAGDAEKNGTPPGSKSRAAGVAKPSRQVRGSVSVESGAAIDKKRGRNSTVMGIGGNLVSPNVRPKSKEESDEDTEAKDEAKKRSDDLLLLKDNPDRELVPFEFNEALIRLAANKYKSEAGSTSERLQMFITKDLIPKACRIDTNPFRKLLCDPMVDRTYRAQGTHLKRIFAYYASFDKADKENNRLATINLEEFKQFMKDCQLLTSDFTDVTVGTIFGNILAEVDEESASTRGGEVGQMLYAEFLESIAATTVYKIQNPYLPLDRRIDTFLTNYVLPNAKQTKDTKALKAFDVDKEKVRKRRKSSAVGKMVGGVKALNAAVDYDQVAKDKERIVYEKKQALKKAEYEANSALSQIGLG